MERPEGSDEMPPDVKPDTKSKPANRSTPSSAPDPTRTEENKPGPKEEPIDEPMEVEDDSEAKAKTDAEDFKAKGNVAYKGKNFDEAVELYQKAWDVWPKDVAFLTNLSGKCDEREREVMLTSLSCVL